MLIGTGIGKGTTFLAQIALGWLLSKDAFGAFALATSIASFVAIIRNGGIQQILIQRGRDYCSLAPVAFKFSLSFNTIACLLLICAAPFASHVYEIPSLTVLIICIAISLPLSTPFIIFRAKLAIDHRFRSIAGISTSAAVLRQGTAVLFAFFGFGAKSFVLPIILESVFSSLAGWFAVRQWPRGGVLDRRHFSILFKQARWVMLGSFAVALTQQGHYVVLGLFMDAVTLGTYFFAAQLTLAVSTVFVSSIEAVMFPALAKQAGRPDDQVGLFLKSLTGICYVSFLTAFGVWVCVEPLVNFIWQGRWNDAIPIAQLFTIGIPAALLISLGRSLLEAQGRWRLRSILLACYGITEVSVAGIAASFGDSVTIAKAVALFRVGFSFLQIFVAAWKLPIDLRVPVRAMLRPVLFLSLSALIGLILRASYLDTLSGLFAAIATMAIFIAVTGVLGFSLFRSQGRELLAYLNLCLAVKRR